MGIILIPIIYIRPISKKNIEVNLEIKNPNLGQIEYPATMYTNTDYGFSLILPIDWVGYTVASTTVDSGIQITLRHPLWMIVSPRMDIPVLIYPLATWENWEKTNFEGYKTAAPIGPTERSRNTKYVFATAPRYNFSFLPSFEEVEEIIKTLQGL
ncbi:MAG: hypothetical protein RI996_36 [Candidatus Parcubacteria bacterium]